MWGSKTHLCLQTGFLEGWCRRHYWQGLLTSGSRREGELPSFTENNPVSYDNRVKTLKVLGNSVKQQPESKIVWVWSMNFRNSHNIITNHGSFTWGQKKTSLFRKLKKLLFVQGLKKKIKVFLVNNKTNEITDW